MPVSASDPKELATVRDGFAAKKLGLSADAADAGIKVGRGEDEGHESPEPGHLLLLAGRGDRNDGQACLISTKSTKQKGMS